MSILKTFSSKKSGFTLIEIIVSLALFSVVVTIAVGALLILIASNRQLQNEQSVLSNLSFALDSMTREIRTGSNYFCDAENIQSTGQSGQLLFVNSGSASQMNLADGVRGDCHTADDSTMSNFHGISFDEGGDSITGASNKRIVYFFNRAEGQLFRRLSGEAPESIVSAGIFIKDADFYVTGSNRPTGSPSDDIQPRITIVLEAYNSEQEAVADTTGERAYVIQTTVTQRSLDI
jgi:prepilin-type N-terminal cleavage/methylation domain-containing protein